MLNRGSGLGPLVAAFVKRAASDWRTVPWLVGGVSLLILPAWFAAFREPPPSRLRVHSATPLTPMPVRSPAVKTDLSGPPVIPDVLARLNPARAAAGVPSPARRAGAGSASSSFEPEPAEPEVRARIRGEERAALAGFPSRSGTSAAGAGGGPIAAAAPAGVPLTPFSRQNQAAPPSGEERGSGAAPPRAAAAGRSGGGAPGAGAGPSPGANQPAAAPAAGSAIAQAASSPGAIGSGSAGGAGAPAAGGVSASGLESIAAPAHAAAASALAMGGAAAVDASGMAQASIAASAKCAETSAYWTPIIQKASQEMLALNNQAIACGPTIKCGFASHQYCMEPDMVPLWWKSYYESRCACARKHCEVRDKCEEVNRLNCQQLHACPITASKPCQTSPCDY